MDTSDQATGLPPLDILEPEVTMLVLGVVYSEGLAAGYTPDNDEFTAVGQFWCLAHQWASERRHYCPSESDTACQMVQLGYQSAAPTDQGDDAPPVGIPYLLTCATPGCESVTAVTTNEDYADWSLLEDGDDAFWLCPDCPIESDWWQSRT